MEMGDDCVKCDGDVLKVLAAVRIVNDDKSEVWYGPFDSEEHAEDWVMDAFPNYDQIADCIFVDCLVDPKHGYDGKLRQDKFAWRASDLDDITELVKEKEKKDDGIRQH